MPMPNFRNISSYDTIKVAEKLGYSVIRQKGSHIILKNNTGKILVIPQRRCLKMGTALQIIKALGLTKEEFLKMI